MSEVPAENEIQRAAMLHGGPRRSMDLRRKNQRYIPLEGRADQYISVANATLSTSKHNEQQMDGMLSCKEENGVTK